MAPPRSATSDQETGRLNPGWTRRVYVRPRNQQRCRPQLRSIYSAALAILFIQSLQRLKGASATPIIYQSYQQAANQELLDVEATMTNVTTENSTVSAELSVDSVPSADIKMLRDEVIIASHLDEMPQQSDPIVPDFSKGQDEKTSTERVTTFTKEDSMQTSMPSTERPSHLDEIHRQTGPLIAEKDLSGANVTDISSELVTKGDSTVSQLQTSETSTAELLVVQKQLDLALAKQNFSQFQALFEVQDEEASTTQKVTTEGVTVSAKEASTEASTTGMTERTTSEMPAEDSTVSKEEAFTEASTAGMTETTTSKIPRTEGSTVSATEEASTEASTTGMTETITSKQPTETSTVSAKEESSTESSTVTIETTTDKIATESSTVSAKEASTESSTVMIETPTDELLTEGSTVSANEEASTVAFTTSTEPPTEESPREVATVSAQEVPSTEVSTAVTEPSKEDILADLIAYSVEEASTTSASEEASTERAEMTEEELQMIETMIELDLFRPENHGPEYHDFDAPLDIDDFDYYEVGVGLENDRKGSKDELDYGGFVNWSSFWL